MGFSTDAIHIGQEPDPATGAIIVPIYQTSTYVQEELGRHKGYEYSRTSNPTRAALERNLACLEGGEFGFAFASGMAAINAVLTLFKSGDHVVTGRNLYGGTFRLFERVLRNSGFEFTYVDTTKLNTRHLTLPMTASLKPLRRSCRSLVTSGVSGVLTECSSRRPPRSQTWNPTLTS